MQGCKIPNVAGTLPQSTVHQALCVSGNTGFPIKMTLETSGCPSPSEVQESDLLLHHTVTPACPRHQTIIPLITLGYQQCHIQRVNPPPEPQSCYKSVKGDALYFRTVQQVS